MNDGLDYSRIHFIQNAYHDTRRCTESDIQEFDVPLLFLDFRRPCDLVSEGGSSSKESPRDI